MVNTPRMSVSALPPSPPYLSVGPRNRGTLEEAFTAIGYQNMCVYWQKSLKRTLTRGEKGPGSFRVIRNISPMLW